MKLPRILKAIPREFVHLVLTGWRQYWWGVKVARLRRCCDGFPESVDKVTLICSASNCKRNHSLTEADKDVHHGG